ncbi:DoxX family protein [Mycolicibacterium diernhoferi]|uniref:DoxX family protein n=1 Tax=Mycolicibacterium diernhoferi TaxID=1801 RepID=A0A1Q4H9W5_9MYCO|nr:DoxX family protein [Mycolicibacterium diernhoferi]OJZ64334.1 DoxX family protein [Mycolicibacterium diernhoferi]OPE47223.1 DoxX subfamily protein [Mycolicibacterium diernhoferi]PEG53467.1 DoxX family protein [Mycolicibacterium diernhoferi]QYL24152.1 DoxX family protein [Mycolicibacterium diernhoferi]
MLVRRIARPLLSAAFIGQGIEALRDVKPAAQVVQPTLDAAQSLPSPVADQIPDNAVTVARINAAVQIGGGLLLATGRIPRVASALLAATVVPGNLGKHMFWEESDPALKAEKRLGFLTDLSLIGGLVLASADTAGKPSLGWRGRRAGRRVAEKVSAVLPSSNDALIDAELTEKLSHGVQVGVERGRELAETALDRAAPLAATAYERSAHALRKAEDRAAPLAATAFERSALALQKGADKAAPLAAEAYERSALALQKGAHKAAPLAEQARRRGTELAETALEQGGEQLSSRWRRVRG